MKNKKFKAILWDFDGVIINSNEVRELGFRECLKEYPLDQVNSLIAFHRKNGGLSRYVKFVHFFEVIRGESIMNEKLHELTSMFTLIMKELLTDRNLLNLEVVKFLNENKTRTMYIVSGSDQNELRELCRVHGLSDFFVEMYGSPTPKIQLVQNIIENNAIDRSDYILIGDAMNDYYAAVENQIEFAGYNNTDLIGLGLTYIQEINQFAY